MQIDIDEYILYYVYVYIKKFIQLNKALVKV